MPRVLALREELLQGRVQRTAADDLVRRWPNSIGLAVTVGVVYFLAARLSVDLVLPDGVAVFWPAAGVSSGVLIALGPHARWPVAAVVTAATVVVHKLVGDFQWAAIALGLCNAAEALITAGLLRHYFGADFSIGRLRPILGFFLAAIVGTAISGIGGAATYRLLQGPSATLLATWQDWFASDLIGIIIVAPLTIGLYEARRQPTSRGEIIEGTVALVAITAMTGIAISLPSETWETVCRSLCYSQCCCGSPPVVNHSSQRQRRSWSPLLSLLRQFLTLVISHNSVLHMPTGKPKSLYCLWRLAHMFLLRCLPSGDKAKPASLARTGR